MPRDHPSRALIHPQVTAKKLAGQQAVIAVG
jgi:hypothetical protein